MKEDLTLSAGYVVAGLGPLTASIALTPLRGQPQGGSIVGVVLIAAITVAAVLGGPAAGAVATVTAVLSFDFLFVRPYLTLQVPSSDTIAPVATLLGLGSGVVAIVRRRWPPSPAETRARRTRHPNQSQHIERVVRLIGQGADPRDLVSAVQAELTGLLLLRGCRFETDLVPTHRGRVGRSGRLVGQDGMLSVAQDELELPVGVMSLAVGRFVLTPTPGVSIPLEHRIVAVILTDHLAAAIASGPRAAPR